MQEEQAAIEQFQQRRRDEIHRTQERRQQQQDELKQHELRLKDMKAHARSKLNRHAPLTDGDQTPELVLHDVHR